MFATSALLFSLINGNILERIQHLKVPEPVLEGGTLKMSWSDCGGANSHGKTTSLTPGTMTLGQKTEMIGKGTVDETVTGGSFTMKIKAGILNKTFQGEICSPKTFRISELGIHVGTMTWEGMDCPVKPGPNTVKMSTTLSGSLPRSLARSTIHVTAKDQNGGELICLDVKTE